MYLRHFTVTRYPLYSFKHNLKAGILWPAHLTTLSSFRYVPGYSHFMCDAPLYVTVITFLQKFISNFVTHIRNTTISCLFARLWQMWAWQPRCGSPHWCAYVRACSKRSLDFNILEWDRSNWCSFFEGRCVWLVTSMSIRILLSCQEKTN